MPRLTDQHYLAICRRLRALWLTAPDVFSFITALDQWTLHDYFKPAQELTDADRLVHRRGITDRWPSLPQQAGRALPKLDDTATAWAVGRQRPSMPPSGARRHRGEPMKFKTYGLVQPEVDIEALLQVLLDIANQPEDHEPPEPGHVEDHLAS